MTNSEVLPTTLSGDGAPKPVAERRVLRKFAVFAIFTALFAVAFIASWQLRSQFSEAEEHLRVTQRDPEEKKRAPLKKIEAGGTPLEALQFGDHALAQHRFGEALAHYEDLLAREPNSAVLIDYRLGLCNESVGALEKAQEAYRKAIAGGSSPALIFAAHLGVARCLLRGDHPAEARRLLYPYLHEETRQFSLPPALMEGARSVVALAFTREVCRSASANPFDDAPLASFSVGLEVPFYLDEIAPAAIRTLEPNVDTIVMPVKIKKQKDPCETIVERVEQIDQPAGKVLELLVNEAGLRAKWTDEARKAVSDRPLRLSLRDWPLVELLEQVADRFDLCCRLEADVVSFAARAETDSKELLEGRAEGAKRALLRAVVAEESHPWTPAIYLELGNAEAARGRSKKAAIWFERLLRKAPGSAYAAPACYNLALTYQREQEISLARQTFFRAIDQAPGHELALRALTRIGQSYLEEGDAGEAIRQFRRAELLAPKSPWQSVNALLLAAAHLQNGDNPGARFALAKHRNLLQKEPCKSAAAFLDAYAQYRLAKPVNGAPREAGELLNSLWADLDARLLGPLGSLLSAQAFHDLGFLGQAERLLRTALTKARGPITPPLEHLLAESLIAQHRQDEAIPLLEKLAATSSGLGSNARFRLAQIDLQKKRFKQCVERCQELWRDGALTDSAALLNLWGAALEGTGDFANAARCFSGKPPE